MATVEQVATSALGALNSDAGVILAAAWVNDRYEDFALRTRLRQLRRVGELAIPAAYTTGTVSVTQGSKIVTGVGVTWTADMANRYFQLKQTWYAVAAVFPAENRLDLVTPISEATIAGAGYRLVPRYHALPRDVRSLGRFVHMRLFLPLDEVSQDTLTAIAPQRFYQGSGPQIVSELGENDDGVRLVEIYPYSTLPEIIHYVYWRRPKVYELDDELPSSLDRSTLKIGVMADVMKYAAAMALQKGDVQQHGSWLNMANQQETRWEQRLGYAMAQDIGLDDLAFIAASSQSSGFRDIATAHDEVWSRGRRFS